MHVILLTPKNKSIAPHIWKEGGKFKTKESAEFQAKQTRKMKDLYEKVDVVPADVELFLVKDLEGKYNGVYLVAKVNTAQAKKVGHKYSLQYSSYLKNDGYGNYCTFPTKEQAVSAAQKLSA